MPTTTNYAFPYPALSDAPNGPSQIGSLATAVDTQILTTTNAYIAADTALPQGKMIRRHRRTTSSTAASALTGVCTLAIPVVSGRLYKVQVPQVHANSTVVNDVVTVSILFNLGGTVTTASPVLPGAQALFQVISNSVTPGCLSTSYSPGSTNTLNIMLVTFRNSGTGNSSLFADGTRVTDLEVWDLGVDPGVSGVNI